MAKENLPHLQISRKFTLNPGDPSSGCESKGRQTMRKCIPQETDTENQFRDPWFNKPKQEYLEESALRTLHALRDMEKARESLSGAILWAGSSELPIGDFWVEYTMVISDLNGAVRSLNGMLEILFDKMASPHKFRTEVMAKIRRDDHRMLPAGSVETPF